MILLLIMINLNRKTVDLTVKKTKFLAELHDKTSVMVRTLDIRYNVAQLFIPDFFLVVPIKRLLMRNMSF